MEKWPQGPSWDVLRRIRNEIVRFSVLKVKTLKKENFEKFPTPGQTLEFLWRSDPIDPSKVFSTFDLGTNL